MPKLHQSLQGSAKLLCEIDKNNFVCKLRFTTPHKGLEEMIKNSPCFMKIQPAFETDRFSWWDEKLKCPLCKLRSKDGWYYAIPQGTNVKTILRLPYEIFYWWISTPSAPSSTLFSFISFKDDKVNEEEEFILEVMLQGSQGHLPEPSKINEAKVAPSSSSAIVEDYKNFVPESNNDVSPSVDSVNQDKEPPRKEDESPRVDSGYQQEASSQPSYGSDASSNFASDATFKDSTPSSSDHNFSSQANEGQGSDSSNSFNANSSSETVHTYTKTTTTVVKSSKSGKGALIGIIVGVIVLLAVLGGLAFVFKDNIMSLLNGSSSQTASAPANPESKEEKPAPAPAANKCSLEGDDRTVLQNCLSSSPSDEDLYTLIGSAIKHDRCDLALRILSAKGRSPSGSTYAYILAMFYAPSTSFNSSCMAKSAQEAQYWAQRAQSDKNFNEGKAREVLNKYIENAQ